VTATVTDPLLLAADLLDPPDRDVFRLLGYTPDPAQQRFHDATEFDVGYGGLAGAGKSLALLMEGVRAAATYPGMRVGAFRRTFDEIEESLLSKLALMQDDLANHFGCRLIVGNRPELRYRNGSVIRFRYAETLADATRRQGGEYQLVLVDERQQVPPAVVQYLETRIRSGAPGVPVLGIRSTFNPGDIGHADLKERFIDKTGAGRNTYQTVDPVTQAPTGRWVRFVPGERSSHIDNAYWSRLQAIEDPVLRRQLAEGDWDAGGGLMFSATWRRTTHVVSPEDVPVPEGAGVVRARGIDYGMSAPFCCLWGAKFPDDLVVIYREVYQTGLTPVEQARLILGSEDESERRLISAALDPACWTQYANAKRSPGVPVKSIAADYSKAGLPVVKAQNDRIGGVRLVHDALRVRDDGLPRLLVYDTCPNLIKQLGGLPRSKTNPEDVNTNAEDHAYDALRYVLYQLLGKRATTGDQRSSSLGKPLSAGVRRQAF
jgi:hypothetical protein